mmetsp:Transcript_26078/g.69583  ORF Transcript_26078/g.69583 Transcript_26078/m.69583 type:complete len:285 (+) Transcript_26078:170-1024(+)
MPRRSTGRLRPRLHVGEGKRRVRVRARSLLPQRPVAVPSRSPPALRASLLRLLLLRHLLDDRVQLGDHFARLREAAALELRVQHLPIERDLERVDRLERLGDDVEAVDAGGGHKLVLVHLVDERRRRTACHAEELLAQEEGDGDARLRAADRADAVLHRRRRRVGAALYLERGKLLLQRRRGATELPARLSRCTKLDAKRIVHLLDGRDVVVRDNVEGAEVDVARLVVHLLEDRRADEHGREAKEHLLVGRETARHGAYAPALDVRALPHGRHFAAKAGWRRPL